MKKKLIIFLSIVLCITSSILASPNDTEIVSISKNGTVGNNNSFLPSISADGRFVSFSSVATNLVPNDTNKSSDIFVYDREQKTIERVSVDGIGNQGDNESNYPAISADGNFIAFSSMATNLVPNDTNKSSDIFVYNRQLKTTERVSVDSSGNQGNKDSYYPAISADGNIIAFVSTATNLVPNDTNKSSDIFVYNRTEKTIEQIAAKFVLFLSISADGRFITFTSADDNLVPNDTNKLPDIFVYDRQNKKYERVNVDNQGNQSDNISNSPSISADGKFVAFQSEAANLVPNDTNNSFDVFIYNRNQKSIERISTNDSGIQGDNNSGLPSISADGRFVSFVSAASNLVPNDINNKNDIFVYDREKHHIQKVSVNSSGISANNDCLYSSLSADGTFVVFDSLASNLVPNDTNFNFDVFVHELPGMQTAQSPIGKNVFPYLAVDTPEIDSAPEKSKPFAISNLSEAKLTFSVGLPNFDNPVDIYLALSLDKYSGRIFFINSSNSVQNTATPWKTNQTDGIEHIKIFENIQKNLLPSGTYTLYTLIVPTGATNMDDSYLWLTSFTLVN